MEVIKDSLASLPRRILAALRKPMRVVGLTIILMAVFLLEAVLIEPRWIQVTHVSLSDEPTHTLVHISDIHYKGSSAYLRRAVERINKLNPDFVCLTGDIIETEDMLVEAVDLLHGPLKHLCGLRKHHASLGACLHRRLFRTA